MDPSYGFGGGGGERNFNGRGGSGVGGGGGGIAAPRGYAMSGKIMLSAIVVLFTVVLLILFLHLYVRWRLLRSAARSGRRRGRRLVFAVEGRAVSAGRGRGLDSDALKSLPTLAFSVAVGGGDAGECAVCLSEFEEGEKVRSVPRCGHLFHIECIDSWLRSHVTCPLCRAAVEPVKPAPADERLAVPAAESDSPAAAGVASPPSDLCESCRTEDGTSSSSSESSAAELRIEVRSGAEDELGFGIGPSSGFKSPGGRIQAIRRILSRDPRPCRGGSLSELDLERGEAVEGSPPPPPSPVTPPQLPN